MAPSPFSLIRFIGRIWPMFMVLWLVLGIGAGTLRGGRLQNLGDIQLRLAWAPLAMFALQAVVVIFPVDEGLRPLGPWTLTASYGFLIVFLLANRALPGLKLILLGTSLNLAVMLANGGYMPVTLEALERSGHLDRIVDETYLLGSKDVVLSPEEVRLEPLSDVFETPDWLPFAASFSLGDISIGLGAFWFVYRKMGPTEKSRPSWTYSKS